MKSFFKWLVLLPVVIVALAFAVANRHGVEVVFDPSGLIAPGMTVRAPLFVLLFLAAMVGVLLGGAATWLAQGRHRRAARSARAEVREVCEERARARAEVDHLRKEMAALPAPAMTRDAA